MAEMSCGNCGAQVPSAAHVCPKCGYVFASHERAAARDLRRQVLLVVLAAAVAGAMLALLWAH
jgi:predicted amidophosphoribosyltransferase